MRELPQNWLAPLPLAGGVKFLPNRILPGPMEGITDGSFCRVMASRGLVRAWVTPFIRISTAVPRLARLRQRLEPFGLGGVKAEEGRDAAPADSMPAGPRLPVIVQLMGLDIPLLVETAKRLAELGAAGVDLNCACPSKVVVANGAGGARLRDPHWIRTALCELRKAVPELGVSVKLRAGMADSASELPKILKAVRAAQPDFVMMHFRTVIEEYQVVPGGWERLARAKELLGADIPLLGAGDVVSVDAAAALWRQTGVDGVTPARGLLRNPWLLQEIEAGCEAGAEEGKRQKAEGRSEDGKAEPQRGGVENSPPPSLVTHSPSLIPRHLSPVTMVDRAAFLRELVEASAVAGEWRAGFVLELARNLFGVETELFVALSRARCAEEMVEVLAALAENGNTFPGRRPE